MTVTQFAEKYGIKAIAVESGDREITGGYVGDLLSWVMGRASSGDVWITIMSNINIAAVAALTDVACIVLAEDVQPDEKVVAVAKDKGINLLASERNAFELAGLLYGELNAQ
ncbi:MAG: hypothetical protein E7559_05935 [Ruminococcaceae bacterium]|nr:hypothetical protein [Oscillospiraceae bacterium]